jgi:type IV pilus assembly protein PilW
VKSIDSTRSPSSIIRRRHKQSGLSLVELMVALTIGVLITISILTVYINSSRNFAIDERYARMQENARYALRVLGEDLVMSDFWGQMISTDTISTTLSVTAGDCGDDPEIHNADSALLFNNQHDAGAVDQFTECATISAQRQPDSDVILIKRVEGSPTARVCVDAADTEGDGATAETITTGTSSLVTGTVYLRTNGVSGSLIDDASSGNPPTVGWSDWRYLPRVYFVRNHFETVGDGIPSLCRLDLDDTDLDALSCLAQGIEDMHLEFGIDTDQDGTANRYTATPSTADMETAVSARIHVLMRSDQPVPYYTNTKTFLLGGVAIPSANDGFLRNVFSTTVALRNTASRNIFN